ncbi:acetoin utilization protein AcuC [Antribacter gilvus]|uniref:acetoin utilization protein AcuC n=1 Tax=Antribacter gilvus TaxID=2304675 RepID=UPI000F76726A|nr:acetoin utilization protein AcuC [Antribacter gilvus]
MRVARLVWSPDLLEYDFGPGHPMAPARLALTMRLVADLGLLAQPTLEVTDVAPASDAVVQTVHDPDYVAAVRRAGTALEADEARGLGTEDNPLFHGMHEAAARQVAGSVELAQAVWDGEVLHGLNIAGGMHHAQRGAASGFCVYNDAAAGIQRLLDLGAERVAYVDLDAHHGDGVEAFFWDDPRVLTVSVHEEGRTLFPGTGNPADTGGTGAASGTAVNVALPARTDGPGWLRAVDAVVPPVVRAFDPQVIVSQHGCDAHGLDPLSHLEVPVDAQRTAAEWVHALAHERADGRWVALGGGGYAVVDVVPLVWAALVAEAAHAPVDRGAPLPESWRQAALGMSGIEPARALGSGPVEFRSWRSGYDPADPLDRAVAATRREVFPLLGLDPHHD